jgi:parallel beta-helix repeat protein
MNKILTIIVFFYLIIVGINNIQADHGYTKTIYIDDDNIEGPWYGTILYPYQFIQDGIDNASYNDTIFVLNGTYYENIFINTTVNLISENKNMTIIDGGGKNDVIYIAYPANKVTISGFTIRRSGNYSSSGIFDAGIEIHSDYNLITDNLILQHPHSGILFWASKFNNISHNKITKCGRAGIDFLAGPNNIIFNNLIYNNEEYGITAFGSSNSKNNIISNNVFYRNRKGLAMFDSGNQIFHNNFLNNFDFNAMSHFDLWDMIPSRNSWYGNYWDDWIGFGPKWIPGLFGFNFDWHPASEPYPYQEVY